MSVRYPAIALTTLVFLAACQQQDSTASGAASADAPRTTADCPVADASGQIEIAPGLSARILESGYGRAAAIGDYADTNVQLWLLDESAEDRRGKFIWESGARPFQFQLGRGQVIKGWDLGVPCMLVGETRELVIPPELAYGAAGRGEIPPNAALIFTIELARLKTPE